MNKLSKQTQVQLALSGYKPYRLYNENSCHYTVRASDIPHKGKLLVLSLRIHQEMQDKYIACCEAHRKIYSEYPLIEL